jgi:hypothetical protein
MRSGLSRILGKLNTASLSSTSGMYLGFNYADSTTHIIGGSLYLTSGIAKMPRQNRQTVTRHQLF